MKIENKQGNGVLPCAVSVIGSGCFCGLDKMRFAKGKGSFANFGLAWIVRFANVPFERWILKLNI